MSRTNHLRNIQRQTKEQVKRQDEQNQNTHQGKDKNYSSYFYRDPPANNNVSPSPSSSNANTIAISKSKDSKNMKATRLLTKNNNSNIYGTGNNKKYGQEQFLALKRQNKQLRNQIVELKVNQFYQFDNNKLKDLIADVQKLKDQVSRLKDQNQLLKLQNDFLNRTNFQLKKQRQIQSPQQRKFKNKQTQQTFCQKINLKSQIKVDKKKQSLTTFQTQTNIPYPNIQNQKTVNFRNRQKQKIQTDDQIRPYSRRQKSDIKNTSKLSQQKLIQRYINRKKLNTQGSDNQI